MQIQKCFNRQAGPLQSRWSPAIQPRPCATAHHCPPLRAISPPDEEVETSTRREGTAEIFDDGPAWTLPEYQKLFRNYDMEESYEIEDITGELPADIEGTFYRNGPGIMELNGHRMHAFDGHAVIAKIAIKDGRASFRTKYIQTEVYQKEVKEAGEVIYRGFGSQKPGGITNNFMDFEDKPVGNTSVMEWGGKLYALWEAHNPNILDPDTLETLGLETFHGMLRDAQPFTAHPCYDKYKDRLVAFSNGIRHGEGKLHIWEFDHEGHVQQSVTHKVGMLPVLYLHDFQITKNWYIFHQGPFDLEPVNLVRYFVGLCDQTQQITFNDARESKWWLVPRSGGEPLLIDSEPSMIWHYGNAFEDEETGTITVDACTMKEFNFDSFEMRNPSTVPGGEVLRHIIDPQAKSSSSKRIMPGLGAGDFPQTNPKFQMDPNYRYLYVAGTVDESEAFPFRRVIKLDMNEGTRDSWLAPNGCFVSEPVYVPRKDSTSAAEDDG